MASETPPEASPARRRYEILGVLGRGGFGTVYAAIQRDGLGFEQLVALKVALPGAFSDVQLRRLIDEAKLLARIRHRAIVHALGLVSVDGQPTLVMEFVHGASLDRLLRHEALPPHVALEILAELAAALHAAWYTQGPGGQLLRLVHRDIKPANIMISPNGEVKLLDFGIARTAVDQRFATPTATGMVQGTAGYVAPEVLEGARAEASADIFSLGVLLYNLLSGEELRGLVPSERKYRARVKGARATLEGTIGPEQRQILDLLEQLLAFKPGERPTADELVDACHRLLSRMSSEQRLYTWARQTFASTSTGPTHIGPLTNDPRAGRTFTEETLPQDFSQLSPDMRREGPQLGQMYGVASSADRLQIAGSAPPQPAVPSIPPPAASDAPPAPLPLQPPLAPPVGTGAQQTIASPPHVGPLPSAGARRPLIVAILGGLMAGAFAVGMMGVGLWWKNRTGSVMVEVSPAQATVLVDGVAVGRGDQALEDIRTGPHRVTGALDGYKVQELDITVEAGQVTRAILDLRPLTGGIDLSVSPAEATVSLDDVPVGAGPRSLVGLSPGLHRVSGALDGYEPQEVAVTVEAGEVAQAALQLQASPQPGGTSVRAPAKGTVRVTGSAGAKVALVQKQKTVYTISAGSSDDVNAGKYAVQVSFPNAMGTNDAGTVLVDSGGTVTLNCNAFGRTCTQ